MSREIWKPIPGYLERYEASSLGRIRTIPRMGFHPKNKHGKTHLFRIPRKILRTQIDRYGYVQINIKSKNGHTKTWNAHRLIAFAFLSEQYFDGAQVNHKNGNRTDNRILNLEWCTPKQNIAHRDMMKQKGTV